MFSDFDSLPFLLSFVAIGFVHFIVSCENSMKCRGDKKGPELLDVIAA